jgi:hypothetical protein
MHTDDAYRRRRDLAGVVFRDEADALERRLLGGSESGGGVKV